MQQLRGSPGRKLVARKFRAIEGVRAQRTFEVHPARGRMPVVEMRGGTEETLFADLALERARRQVGVRLARGLTLDSREVDVAFHEHLGRGVPI